MYNINEMHSSQRTVAASLLIRFDEIENNIIRSSTGP